MTRTRTKTPPPARAAKAGKSGRLEKPPRKLSTIWQVIALVAVAGVAYHNSLGGPFIFDDVMAIRHYVQVRRLWPSWEAGWGPRGGGGADLRGAIRAPNETQAKFAPGGRGDLAQDFNPGLGRRRAPGLHSQA